MIDRTLIPDTWYKWNVFGDIANFPLYIRFIGRVIVLDGNTTPNLVFYCQNGQKFYGNRRFIEHLLPLATNEPEPKHNFIWWRTGLQHSGKLLDGSSDKKPDCEKDCKTLVK